MKVFPTKKRFGVSARSWGKPQKDGKDFLRPARQFTYGWERTVKKFKYRLDTVLTYKTQVLDNLKTEHALILQNVNRKQEEIHGLHRDLLGYEDEFNRTKAEGAPISNYMLFDMCIGRMEQIIDEEKERLKELQRQENEKKQEVITAKVDTSRFEKLKDRKIMEYQKEVAKADEAFIEEFVSNASLRIRHQHRGS